MAANYLHSLADENPDLQKQFRCATGVFQIFNRHHIVSRRRVNHRDSTALEKHRVSTESYQDSFSSWSPSSYKDYKTIIEKDSNNWYHDEPRELSRSKSCQFKDGFSFSISEDYPRFSYDGRETDNLYIKPGSQTTNSRLSLDSKERSIRTLNSVSLVPLKPSNTSTRFPRNPKINNGPDADKDLSHTRAPGVVAKLMGLETFPSPKSLNLSNDCASMNKREPVSPRWKNLEMKPISRVSIEPAPWKRDSARAMTSLTKIRGGPVSNVYSEVDKRLKNLEFGESGKDLRALKQILEAMQTVEAKSLDHCNHENTLFESKESGGSHESRIVIMKPAKKGLTGKDLITETTRGDMRSRPSVPRVDSSRPRKQSDKQKLDSQSRTRRQSSSSTLEKSTMAVKVGDDSEHPSPVSVLDNSVYVETSPSHVKHTPITKKDDTPSNPANNIVRTQNEARNGFQPKTTVSFQTTREKLKKVSELVEKLKSLNSSHSEDYITTLCEHTNTNTNCNNKYISQIFLASGLVLRDLKCFKFHPSGHPINPDLFLVMERTKYSNHQKGKLHRKLIFDVVNEILVSKLSSDSRMMMMKMVIKNPKDLLTEVCLEVERMQVCKKRHGCVPANEEDDLKGVLLDDLSKNSENWNGFYGESWMIGMEVERLIFKDLVDEVVVAGAPASFPAYPVDSKRISGG